MDGYRVLTLGEEARTFMRESLQDGNTLASLVHELVDFEKGSITTLFNEDVDPANALLFESGWDIGSDDARDYLISVADALEAKAGPLMWVMEEILFDGVLNLERRKQEGIPVRILNTDVYYVLSSALHSSDAIATALRQANTSLYALTVVSPFEKHLDLSSLRGEITVDFLRSVVERAPLIAMGAYDGEGILVWRRDTDLARG